MMVKIIADFYYGLAPWLAECQALCLHLILQPGKARMMVHFVLQMRKLRLEEYATSPSAQVSPSLLSPCPHPQQGSTATHSDTSWEKARRKMRLMKRSLSEKRFSLFNAPRSPHCGLHRASWRPLHPGTPPSPTSQGSL